MNDAGSPRTCKWLVWTLLIVLLIVHQDSWWWDDRTIVLGFMPIGLAYHALYSILAGVVWLAAVRFAWPADIETWADETNAPAPGEGEAR